jgi:hypothetical protein
VSRDHTHCEDVADPIAPRLAHFGEVDHPTAEESHRFARSADPIAEEPYPLCKEAPLFAQKSTTTSWMAPALCDGGRACAEVDRDFCEIEPHPASGGPPSAVPKDPTLHANVDDHLVKGHELLRSGRDFHGVARKSSKWAPALHGVGLDLCEVGHDFDGAGLDG